MKWNWKCLMTSTSLGQCQQKSPSLLTLPFLSVRMVLTEWPEGSWGPDYLKAVGHSFCSPATRRAALALASLPADAGISLDAFAHRRSSHQLAAHRPLEHMGQRGNRPKLLPCSTFLVELFLPEEKGWCLGLGKLRSWWGVESLTQPAAITAAATSAPLCAH